MKLEEATAYVAKCFNGGLPPCSVACPFGVDVRSFMEKMEKGRHLAAYKLYRDAVAFPAIVSALCPQPCRERCQRAAVGDEAVAIRELESACVRLVKDRRPESYAIPPKPQRIAVVGAGIAGLSCALGMAQKKYSVTVFEKGPGWGGSLRAHPNFESFDKEIALQFSAVNVEFEFGAAVGSLSELSGFDSVYIATGEGGNTFGLLESYDPVLKSTGVPGVFMGGGVCGMPLMESIAAGIEMSKTMEFYLQTGRVEEAPEEGAKGEIKHFAPNSAASKPLVRPSSPEGYTAEEAKAEASRCFKCDCDRCEASCEMLRRYRKKPHKMAVEVFADSQTSTTLSSRTITREVYSCNICSHCRGVCPEGVDIGELMQFSREDRFAAGRDIPAFHDFWLREMDFNTSEAFFASPPKGSSTCRYAFFPGCQLGGAGPAYVLKSYEYLSERHGAGVIVGCCGAPAYWAGDRRRLEENAGRIRSALRDMGSPALIFACAYCEKVFSMFMPEIERVSLYEVMASDGFIPPFRPFERAAVFDPCASRDFEGMKSGVRALAARAGTELEELAEPHRCCGYGGHMRLANPELYDEIAANRAQAADSPYIVYCANCLEVLRQKGKACAHILDFAFGLDIGDRTPRLHEKRENSLEVKRRLMKSISGEEFTPTVREWDGLKLVVGDELMEEMERKLITVDDLKEAIWTAENTGEKFVSESDGVYQCSLVRRVITYWVRYRKIAPDVYEVLDAYSHRMKFIREA